ncbi:hypothetical protein ACA910_013565 [Epithemia clementina (nom. ined.)]
MMYQCLMKSAKEDAKSKLATENKDFHEDGPTLLHYLVTNLITSTFSSAQATREQLSNFHPKRFKYDIAQVNGYIRSAIKTLRSAGTSTTTITNAEIRYYQFKIYKKIKSPAEWASKMLFLENTAAGDLTYSPDTLFNDTQSHYQTLVDSNLWRPSDKSPEEQAIAMAAQHKTEQSKSNSGKGHNKKNEKDKGKRDDQDKKKPPFADKEGKEGKTKKWNNKMYYYCPAKQWHTFKVKDCCTYKKWKSEGSPPHDSKPGTDTQVTVDKEKLKRGMAALLPSGDYDINDLAEALAAVLQE